MSATEAINIFRGSLDADGWEPFRYPQGGEIQEFGEVIPFRLTGSAGNLLAVGLWRAGTGVSPVYTSELGDETFLVLEGEVRIDFLQTGESVLLVKGDVGSWSKGTPTRWRLEGPFKKLYVVADVAPPPR